jgi:hypothetical protein
LRKLSKWARYREGRGAKGPNFLGGFEESDGTPEDSRCPGHPAAHPHSRMSEHVAVKHMSIGHPLCVATQQFVRCADVFWCWNVMMYLYKCSKRSVGPWLDCSPTRSPGADHLSRGLQAATLYFAHVYTFRMAVTATYFPQQN